MNETECYPCDQMCSITVRLPKKLSTPSLNPMEQERKQSSDVEMLKSFGYFIHTLKAAKTQEHSKKMLLCNLFCWNNPQNGPCWLCLSMVLMDHVDYAWVSFLGVIHMFVSVVKGETLSWVVDVAGDSIKVCYVSGHSQHNITLFGHNISMWTVSGGS